MVVCPYFCNSACLAGGARQQLEEVATERDVAQEVVAREGHGPAANEIRTPDPN